MFAVGVISVRGGCNRCSRGNTWNKQPRTEQSDYSSSLKYGINTFTRQNLRGDTTACHANLY